MAEIKEPVIVDAVRTPVGKRGKVLGAGFPETVPATTIDRQCGSSQQAVHSAAQGIVSTLLRGRAHTSQSGPRLVLRRLSCQNPTCAANLSPSRPR